MRERALAFELERQREEMARSTATIRELAGVSVLDFAGVLMIGESSTLFRKTMQELIAAGSTRIILNFRELTAVDSAGIGELVATYALTKARDVRVRLLNPPQKVQGVFKLTNISNLFDVYSDEELARNSFEKP